MTHRTFIVAIAALLAAPIAVFAQESTPWAPPSSAAAGPATPPPGAAVTPPEEKGWMITSPFANIAWPEVKMPKIQWNTPKPTGAEQGNALSRFFGGPVNKVRSSTRGALTRTRTAWNNTIDKFRWNKSPAAPNNEPGFFARLLSPPPEHEDPATVTEFLAQPRPGTIRR